MLYFFRFPNLLPRISRWPHKRGGRDLQGDEGVGIEGEDQLPGERGSQEITPGHVRSGIAEDDEDLDEAREHHQEDRGDDLVADRVIVRNALQHGGT